MFENRIPRKCLRLTKKEKRLKPLLSLNVTFWRPFPVLSCYLGGKNASVLGASSGLMGILILCEPSKHSAFQHAHLVFVLPFSDLLIYFLPSLCRFSFLQALEESWGWMTLDQVPSLSLELSDSYTLSGLPAEPGFTGTHIAELTGKSECQIL